MKIILFLSMSTILVTLILGVIFNKLAYESKKDNLLKLLKLNGFITAPLLLMAVMILVPDFIYASTNEGVTSTNGLGLIAAGLSTGFATIGAGYAVGAVASAALGAVSEDPKILGKTLIFVGLAEGIAIYGLIISILILGRI
ncbi:ATP synthase subunit C [Peptostreptococcaceae bacterium AGR-M142]